MYKKQWILPIFLLIQIIGLKLLAFYPEFVETYYSNGLYQYISKFSRIILGWIPFSFGDVLYAILMVWIVYWIYKNWTRTKAKQSEAKLHWKQKLVCVLSFVSVLYFLFHLLWAFNYYRIPLSQKMNLKIDYTDNQLLAFTKKIIAKTNEIQFQITKDTGQQVVNPYTQHEIFKKVLTGYQKLSDTYTFFKYTQPSVKKSLFSYPLTYMGFGGYMNPFTGEAQVNSMIPKYNFPMTTCHEMAHQMGYGSENECNFVGFLAATKNNDFYIKYAGYSNALRYCLSNWEIRNPEIMEQLLKTIHPGVLKNFDESKEFWESHQTFIDSIFEIFYDNFLKLNQQKDGLESYSKFIDLLVNYYEGKSF